MTIAANLGFPRIGKHRELKKAVEDYWAGAIPAQKMMAVASDLKKRHWKLQQTSGVQSIPSNDFSFYDHVLDTVAMLGAVPARFGEHSGNVSLDTYFAMARGLDGVHAMEMTKWFDTNYHYLVPELSPDLDFTLSSRKVLDDYLEAKSAGVETRSVLLGPISFLRLSKIKAGDLSATEYLPKILPVYLDILAQLKAAGAGWVQLDEPILCLDLDREWLRLYAPCYGALAAVAPSIMLTSYFGTIDDKLDTLLPLPVAGIHVDVCRAPNQLDALVARWPQEKTLSLGLVDGRNIWRNDLTKSLFLIERVRATVPADKLQIAPSCSLLHVPVTLELEDDLPSPVKFWLAFGSEKLQELVVLAGAAGEGRLAFASELDESDDIAAERKMSPLTHDTAIRARQAAAEPRLAREERKRLQQDALQLPPMPTTTIGSFPQTKPVRKARLAFKKGAMSDAQYEQFLESEIEKTIRAQEALGLDVLVHGEFERTDMVEYFGEFLEGFALTHFGWVQSYGSRCVKPPIIFGDVSRPCPMTVRWATFAQSLTEKPVKGMLTGPVTILQWSFVRDDQPRGETCRQVAYAVQDEVLDLERAGIRIIQIDEPALREGMPLRLEDAGRYLEDAVTCFQISANAVQGSTQIHTHMCYSEFDDILPTIAALDADVISIEASRSDMDILKSLDLASLQSDVGLGVYDIHSPRCPPVEEMARNIHLAQAHLAADQIWINPDCGLKTRAWDEVLPALENMVAAAALYR